MSDSGKYGGFWIRFVAVIIDNIILGIISFAVIMPILGLLGLGIVNEDVSNMSESIMAMFIGGIASTAYLVQFIISWLYYGLMESGKWQATLGKRALGLKVIDQHGQRISFFTATLRYFGKIVSAAIMFIGYIIAGLTAKKQALHDLIASTYVIRN